MQAHDLAILRSDIPYLQKGIYVDNASVSPLSTRVRIASEHYDTIVADHLREARELSKPFFDKGRELAAKLVGGRPDGIAYVQNTAHGLSLVALGVDWRPGDNLVVSAEEFPSNYLCWLQLASKGVEIRQVTSADGRIEPQQVRALVDERTRVVAVSHVQFYSGFRVDVAALSDICGTFGALLVVDGTQSIGALSLDVETAGVDVLVTSAHKWLMGPRGIGFAAFSSRALAEITPQVVGWQSVNDPFAFNRTLDFLPDARRFEPGTANGCGILGLAERLTQIDELGIDWIETRILDLTEILVEAALGRGLHPVYRFEERSRSGIVLLQQLGTDVNELHARLMENGIYTSIRNGAIRVSPHYYNTPEEMQRIVSIMAEC